MYSLFGLRLGLGVNAKFEWNAHPVESAHSERQSSALRRSCSGLHAVLLSEVVVSVGLFALVASGIFVDGKCCVVVSDQVGFTKYTSPPTPPHHLTSPNSDRAHSCSLAVVFLRRPRPAKRQLTPFVLDATCEDMALRQLTSFVLAGGHLSLGHACEAPRELGHACDAPRELGHACDAPVSG